MIIGNGKLIQSQDRLILQLKLYDKYAKLAKIDKDNVVPKNNDIDSFDKKDYIEIGNIKYDKNDYEEVLDKFKTQDRKMKIHESLHSTLLGTNVSYKYQRGPDGRLYAVGGETTLDTSIPKDPKEAMLKIEQIKKSATAAPELSHADLNIASGANIMKARLLSLIKSE